MPFPKEYTLATPSAIETIPIKKATLFVLLEDFEYEGKELIGVFCSEEEARKAFSEVDNSMRNYVHLYEVELDELYPDGV
jgi:hypothetical protein